MDCLQIRPSVTFQTVLKELHTLPGAPRSIARYFTDPPDQAKISPSTDDALADDAVDRPSELLLLPSDVKWCHQKMRERGILHRIHQLLDDSVIVLPTYEPPPRDPELEARVQKLRNEQGNREYKEMTKSITRERGFFTDVSTVGREMREMHRELNRQLVTGVQYLVSIVGTFFALYVGMSFAFHDFVPRLVIAIIGALMVAFAEIYFIIREDMRAEEMKKKT